MKQKIYGLYLNDNIDDIFYVGRTGRSLTTRLQEHIRESRRGNSLKCAAIAGFVSDGFTINVTCLELIDESEPSSAEELWITNLEGSGLQLVNGKAGDSDKYFFDMDAPDVKNREATPWDSEAFEGVWDPEVIGGKKGEKGRCINGVTFFRRGESKLRFNHPVFGMWDCGGFLWEHMVQTAIKYMTNGTDQHNAMLEWYKRNK